MSAVLPRISENVSFAIYTRHGWEDASDGSSVRVYRENPRCVMSCGSIENALRSLDYYRTECGYTDAWVTFELMCPTCYGSGVTSTSKRGKQKACKCKGERSDEVYLK